MTGFVSLLVLIAVHLFANERRVLRSVWRGQFLSFAAGISFAYVFVDLLPTLERGQPVLRHAFGNLIPYFDRHVYLIALIGMLFYYGLKRGVEAKRKKSFWLSISGYLLFNLLVGAGLADRNNPDIQPLSLFTIAMGMHVFVRDHRVGEEEQGLYRRQGRWWLSAALLAGYAIGSWAHIPDSVAAIAMAFLAGGMLLTVFHYELPKKESGGYLPFLTGSLLYTVIMLSVGEV